LRELDRKRPLAIHRAAESLDYESWFVLAEAHQPGGVTSPLGVAPS